MKKLELNQMEVLEGGNFMDGACAIFAFTGAGIGVAAVWGSIAITGWGLGVLAVGGAACLVYAYY